VAQIGTVTTTTVAASKLICKQKRNGQHRGANLGYFDRRSATTTRSIFHTPSTSSHEQVPTPASVLDACRVIASVGCSYQIYAGASSSQMNTYQVQSCTPSQFHSLSGLAANPPVITVCQPQSMIIPSQPSRCNISARRTWIVRSARANACAGIKVRPIQEA